MDVYLYNHNDVGNLEIRENLLTDNFRADGVLRGRQAAPTTAAPVVATYIPRPLPASAVTLSPQDGLAPQFTTAGRFGSALTTIDAGIRLCTPAPILPAAGDFAMECWFKSDFDPSVTGFIMGQEGRIMTAIETTGGFARLSIWRPQTNLASSVKINDDQWHHIAVQWRADDNTGRMYVDGALAASLTKVMDAGDRPFSIGGWAQSAQFRVRALLCEVAVWRGNKYPAPFTPPSAPHSIEDENIIALWRMNGSLAPENPA